LQAKRELAKKEGRLLTKKQKEEKAMAEIRKQALLASGVQIEGLQQASGSGAPAVKKVVYGNRKKKGPANVAKDASPAPESRPRTPEPVAPTPVVEPKAEAEDDWEASSAEEETAPPAGVKDSWDASSDEEEAAPPPPPAPVSTPAKPVTKPATKPTPAPKKG
jgi:translation initiation factor 5B